MIVSFRPNIYPTLLKCAISKSCSSKTKKNELQIFVSHLIIFSNGLTKPLHSCSNVWPSKHSQMYTLPLPFAFLHFNRRCTLIVFHFVFQDLKPKPKLQSFHDYILFYFVHYYISLEFVCVLELFYFLLMVFVCG